MQFRRGRAGSRAGDIIYNDARERIRDCDVLMYRGRSLESRIIRLVTGAPYSHAGLAVWWKGRLMVLEAVGRGVIVSPLSQNVRHYDGRVDWFTSKEEIPPEDRTAMVEMAQEELGKDYGTWGAIRAGLARLFGRAAQEGDSFRRERKLFCSQYVAQVYNRAGRDLRKGVSDRFMAPGDVAASPLLVRVGRLRKSPAGGRIATPGGL